MKDSKVCSKCGRPLASCSPKFQELVCSPIYRIYCSRKREFNMRLFIFDMDGTVVDSMPALRQLGIYTLTNYTNLTREEAEAHYDATVGMPFEEQLRLLTIPPLLTTEEVKQITKIYEIEHLSMAHSDFEMNYYVKAHLSWLRARTDRKVALVTSSSPEIMATIMAKKGSFHCWDYLQGHTRDDGKLLQIYRVIGKLQISWREVMYFGDSESDANLALELGCRFRRTKVSDFEGEGIYDELNPL